MQISTNLTSTDGVLPYCKLRNSSHSLTFRYKAHEIQTSTSTTGNGCGVSYITVI